MNFKGEQGGGVLSTVDGRCNSVGVHSWVEKPQKRRDILSD